MYLGHPIPHKQIRKLVGEGAVGLPGLLYHVVTCVEKRRSSEDEERPALHIETVRHADNVASPVAPHDALLEAQGRVVPAGRELLALVELVADEDSLALLGPGR
eukprot:4278722-Pyramimonas_sp.AAC.1